MALKHICTYYRTTEREGLFSFLDLDNDMTISTSILGSRVSGILSRYMNVSSTVTDVQWFRLAFIHRSKSVGSHTNNERLEFLGDSVINLVVSHSLYCMFPVADEDVLTRHRSKMVNGTTLSGLGKDVGLLDMAEIEARCVTASAIEDLFEAFVGALYMTYGHDAAYVFVQNVFREHFDWSQLDKWDVCMYKRKIGDVMKSMNTRPVFVRLSPPTIGGKETSMTICIKDTNGKVWGVGKGETRKDAELNAMKKAWDKLNSSATKTV